jgi:hypothetical protein
MRRIYEWAAWFEKLAHFPMPVVDDLLSEMDALIVQLEGAKERERAAFEAGRAADWDQSGVLLRWKHESFKAYLASLREG